MSGPQPYSARPAAVDLVDDQLARAGVWHSITQNANRKRVTSCREASFSRHRLGVDGIPLWDELKTHLGAYDTPEGPRYVAVHCRAHQNRDDEKVAQVVGANVRKLAPEELAAAFGMEYGRVNPFQLAERSDVLQLFDSGVLATYSAPFTMMTNAGDLAWGIEFHAREVVDHLPNARVADIVDGATSSNPTAPVLGILTGNGPESGMELWRRINAAVQAGDRHLRGDTNYPVVTVLSLPGMSLSMELPLREVEVREVVLGGIDTLVDAGATVVGIACNTTQYFSDDIRARCLEREVQFVSLVDSARRVVRELGATSFDLVGIGPVVDLQHWSDFRRLTDEFNVAVPSPRAIAEITGLAWEVKAKEDKTSGSSISKLQNVLSRSTSTDTILIALTELSVALAEHPRIASRLRDESGKQVVDSLTALAQDMAAHYLHYRRAAPPTRASVEVTGTPTSR